MKKSMFLMSALLLFTCVGCNKQHPQTRHIVVMLDVSASIEPESLADAFDSTAQLTHSLRRGDRLTIIPITGDAQNQTSGRILRFQLPRERQPYDSDIARARSQVSQTLEDAKHSSTIHPGDRTDILGAIQVAKEEFVANPGEQEVLIILSDFIQDDGRINFNTDARLARLELVPAVIAALPVSISDLQANTYLGYLRSKDSERLSPNRRQAIRQLWLVVLQKAGAKVTTATDGPGLVRTISRN